METWIQDLNGNLEMDSKLKYLAHSIVFSASLMHFG